MLRRAFIGVLAGSSLGLLAFAALPKGGAPASGGACPQGGSCECDTCDCASCECAQCADCATSCEDCCGQPCGGMACCRDRG